MPRSNVSIIPSDWSRKVTDKPYAYIVEKHILQRIRRLNFSQRCFHNLPWQTCLPYDILNIMQCYQFTSIMNEWVDKPCWHINAPARKVTSKVKIKVIYTIKPLNLFLSIIFKHIFQIQFISPNRVICQICKRTHKAVQRTDIYTKMLHLLSWHVVSSLKLIWR